ncbi:MAG: hypothetical protein QM504_00305 [Pseudomonadota bacterium]
MKECYNYFSCNKIECSSYNHPGSKCWEDESSLCGTHGVEDFNLLQQTVKNKIEACKFCAYYNLVNQATQHISNPQ